MASEATTGGAPLTADGAAEASTSAPPNGSSTAAAGAEGPTTALFDPLYGAKDSLHHQSENAAQLHPLNSSLQSFYSASSADGRLSRDQYRQLIAQIRHSVSQFAATNPALQPQPSSIQQSADASIANQMRRYISLLTETSTHTAALAHSVAPIKTANADRKDAATRTATSAPFPPQLQAGVFRAGSSDKPASSWTCAVDTLAALCQTLENAAKALGLEAFSEPSSEAAEVRSHSTFSSALAHSLTLGAKILVIDIELHILKTGEAPGLSPKAKLKISYANDSADSHQARDPRLAAVLERDVQLIADNLFGLAISDSLQQGRMDVAQALTNWTDNLKDLLLLDDLEAATSQAASSGSRSTDLFAAMQELCFAAVRVTDAEASSSTPKAALLDRGHGHLKLHAERPFLQCIYAHDPTSQQDYTLSVGIQALDLPVADQAAADTHTPSFPLSQSAHDLLASSAASDRFNSLGSVPSAANLEKRVPLHFVVRLSPPVIVTRPTAAKLASICNLKHLSPHNNNPIAPGVGATGATWFEDVLASSWSRRPSQPKENARGSTRCTFTLAQTVESVRSTQSQGLVIDTLPLLSAPSSSPDAMDDGGANQAGASPLTRLFAAIEVLRDEVKVTELMHSAIASSESAAELAGSSQDQGDDLSLDDILASAGGEDSEKIAVTIAFRLPVQGATDEAQQNLSLQLAFRVLSTAGATVAFDACISPSKTSSEVGWLLSAVVRSEASASTGSDEVHLDKASSEAQSIVAKLVDLESLEDVVIGIIGWAEKQLALQFKKPSAANAAFDALSYEQHNVHA
ncbi:Mediator of RNA polymerase II transcription subunit 1 [Pseudozyma hubeiensis]|nr:Mediator of RNA polymerase II transcription subunit 1 [Pseudozyma hubeiensis]